MKRGLIYLLPILLSGCLLDIKGEQGCFEVLPANQSSPYVPIKVNKCTGETWILLKVELAKNEWETTPGHQWQWFRVPGYEVNNSTAN